MVRGVGRPPHTESIRLDEETSDQAGKLKASEDKRPCLVDHVSRLEYNDPHLDLHNGRGRDHQWLGDRIRSLIVAAQVETEAKLQSSSLYFGFKRLVPVATNTGYNYGTRAPVS